MTSKAERKRRRKSRAVTLPGGSTVTPKPTGRDRRHTNQPEDARRTALEARCRVSGHIATREAVEACSSPLRGSDVGLCIQHAHPDLRDQARLWDVWQSMSSARRTWRLRNIGQSGDPQSSSIAMLPDQMQTDQGLTVDLRTPEERDRDAKRAEAYWRARIDALPVPQFRWALRSAIDGFLGGDTGALWRDCAPTANGRNVVRALEQIAQSEGR